MSDTEGITSVRTCRVPSAETWPPRYRLEKSSGLSRMRRANAKAALAKPPTPVGARISPGATSSFITSTGIPSLDDILGGGLPLSCSMLLLAPDAHSAYGELVQKYFVAQGLACGQKLCIVDEDVDRFLSECMWTPAVARPALVDEDEETAGVEDTKIKIAWRYEQMKQFQTTVPTSNQSNEDYSRVFDLTCRIPEDVLMSAKSSGQLSTVTPRPETDSRPGLSVLSALEKVLADEDQREGQSAPIRICVPCLGSADWGDLSQQDICYFLLSMRNLLRRHPTACASISLPSHLCTDSWGGPGWVQKLSWLVDASITLAAFTGTSLITDVPAHHGMVHIHTLPAPTTLLPPSDNGENNLAFKCMRKRMVFETLHLDLEGGVGDRRTTPSSSASTLGEADVPGIIWSTTEGAFGGGEDNYTSSQYE
ncbi:PAXNEB protein-domain-containing protein [Fomitopsis serialis]|uniref:PAXNEB protein-domain-containing protein n=1 Tax=Fomitopsis serialis TaxID=139415 RepID=UPI0020073FF5|nr:PAXNEB protein-domain-containing protein [Neoantrodia serialis]KAH9937128.1 PAXNEB protein-domain-containing protein [Neoantrodia serialis]